MSKHNSQRMFTFPVGGVHLMILRLRGKVRKYNLNPGIQLRTIVSLSELGQDHTT